MRPKALSKMTQDELIKDVQHQSYIVRNTLRRQSGFRDVTQDEEKCYRRMWSAMKKLPKGMLVDINTDVEIGNASYVGARDMVLITGVLYQRLRKEGLLWQEYPIPKDRNWEPPMTEVEVTDMGDLKVLSQGVNQIKATPNQQVDLGLVDKAFNECIGEITDGSKN